MSARPKLIGLLTITCAVLAVGYLVSSAPRSEPPLQAQGATATPTAGPWHRQVESAGDAVLLSLQKAWPEGVNIDDYDARLISIGTLESFLGHTDNERTDDTPVWIVGIVTTDPFSAEEIHQPPGLPVATPPGPVVGAYYVWTANDGLLVSVGPLFPETAPAHARPKFSEIQALSNETFTIVTPSPGPTYGPPPDHTPDA